MRIPYFILRGVSMEAYLLVDFGSTYTKITCVDLDKCEIVATSKDITTIEQGIMVGYTKALEKMKDILGDIEIKKILACSSAAGGLKMVSIGLGKDLTLEAAKRSALGAGARILGAYSYELSDENLDEIENLDCDIILLSGGTNGGNSRNIIYNASRLASRKLNIPIVVAGNEKTQDEIAEIFTKADMEYYITENVMPKVNVLNANPARECIRSIFMDRIVYAKGIDKFRGKIDGVLMPTPAAVLKGAELLSKGSKNITGIGDLIVVDVGGATTDVHSIAEGAVKDIDTRFEGLQEPFEKRTVEGDLGMRYSAISLYEAVGEEKIAYYLKDKSDIYNSCKYRSENVRMIPKSEDEFLFDEAMASTAVETSVKRHCGHIRKEFSYSRYIYYQRGKDLRDVKNIIGTGGVIVHSKNPKNILKSLEKNKDDPLLLTPESPQYYVDKEYILSAMGLLGMVKPDESIKMMKKYLIKLEL